MIEKPTKKRENESKQFSSHEQFASQERFRTSVSDAVRPYVILNAQDVGNEFKSSLRQSFEQLGDALRNKPQIAAAKHNNSHAAWFHPTISHRWAPPATATWLANVAEA